MCDRSRSVVWKRSESRRLRSALVFLTGSLVLAALVWPIPALSEVQPSAASPEGTELAPSGARATIDLPKPTREDDKI